jgi:circadian clock protein KaiC
MNIITVCLEVFVDMTIKTLLSKRLSMGVAGLDEILEGGLIPGRAYLLRGGPGAGKTTLGFHFLTADSADKALFINMGETEEQLRQNAANSGFDLSNVTFLDLSPTPEFFMEVQNYDVFSPADVEREPLTNLITAEVEALLPQRVFLDAMTYFRYLSPDAFQFRKQVHSFLRFLTEKGATVLFTSEGSVTEPDDDLQFMSDGIIHMENTVDERTLTVSKFRGSDFRSGHHVMRLMDKGIEIFPRLVPEIVTREFTTETISSGTPELDELLHGGLERGTITLISGPSGIGKTTFGLQFMKEAAGRGERSVVYTFEEAADTLIRRSQAVNIPISAMVERGTLSIIQVEPLHYSPDEFARLVRKDVEENGTTMVMIDSISGYKLSVRGQNLVGHIHALGKYLQNKGVAVLLINEIEAITGDFRATDIGISYMADNIIFMRYLEIGGEMRRAMGVLKKRLSDFEKTLREYQITRYGFKVGRPLTDLRGILSGTPERTNGHRED